MQKNILVIGFLQDGHFWRDLYSLILANFLKNKFQNIIFLKRILLNLWKHSSHCYNVNQSAYILKFRVFKLDPVQGSGFNQGAWVNSVFFK